MILSLLLSLVSPTQIDHTIAMLSPTPAAERVQLGFYHFRGNRVQVLFDKRQIVNKIIAAAPRGDRSGISDFVWVQLSGCGTLAVVVGKESVSQRFCAGRSAKSVKIEAGPPLKITLLQAFQGND
jgi:hypothetical protein